MQTHVVFGAGLIGSFLGGVFTSLHLNTKLVCRPSIKQKLAKGILLTDYQKNTVHETALEFLNLDNEQNNSPTQNFYDFLWLTVKCTAVDQASIDMHPLVGPETIILCCQNGIGSDQIVKKRYPNNTVLRVMVPFNITEIKPGHLHRGSEGTLCLETLPHTKKVISTLVSKLNTSIMPVTQTNEMQAFLWAKLQLNISNSVNALANIPVKSMLEQRSYRLIIAILMKELLIVTKAVDIKLPKLTALPAKYLPTVLRLPNFLFGLVANKMLAIDPTVKTSMWWDISQGKKTEIDYLNGAILNVGQKLGIDCPANQKIISLIKQMEAANLEHKPRKAFDGNTFLEEIKKTENNSL